MVNGPPLASWRKPAMWRYGPAAGGCSRRGQIKAATPDATARTITPASQPSAMSAPIASMRDSITRNDSTRGDRPPTPRQHDERDAHA